MASIEQALQQATRLSRRSKKLLVFTALTAGLSFQQAHAQTFAEWFKQKSTQKKYLLQQISALMTYRQYAQKGYAIAKGGLGSVTNYLSDEFDLHLDNYKKLRQVNIQARNHPHAKAVLELQHDILQRTNAIQSISGLQASEKGHMGSVCVALLKDCNGLLHDLELLLTDGEVTMSDEQRLRQLYKLHQQMRDNYLFASDFYRQCKVYAAQRQQQQKDLQSIKQLYGK